MTDATMTEAERLSTLVAVWWEAVDSFTRVLEHVGDDEWATPTDLPGWDVHAIAARVHLSEGTVRNHLSAAIGKTGATTRSEAARIAQDRGWL